jgi:hypothetical protein
MLVLLSDKVDGETEVPKTTRTTDSMQIGLRVLREVEVDHDVHRLNIDTTGEQVSANEATGLTILEVVIDAVTVTLLHLGMDVETRVAELRDLLG